MKAQYENANVKKINKNQWLCIGVIALLVAVISHLFFINELFKGNLMTGRNDGLSQMLPFKQFIYNEFTSGNFFYSDSFGWGGGFFSQLGYYFTTNILFLVVLIFVYGLEWVGLIQHPDIQFWADAILPMSIFRLTLIIMVTTAFFRQLSFSLRASMLAAIVYGTSVIYFRHVMFWDFFGDGMLWLVLLLIGVEKIIRRQSPVLFVVAVTINLITNFYFAYINFLLAFIYILLRLLIKFSRNEQKWWKQGVHYSLYGMVGFLVSAFAFVPSVVGFLNNSRPAFQDPIPLLGIVDNIILNGRILYLPALVFIALFFINLYKYPRFRFFAILIIIGLPMHYSPMIGSVFNGFSAPQYRWEYFLCLCIAGVVACVYEYAKEIRLRHVAIGSLLFVGIALLLYKFDPTLIATGWLRIVIPILSVATIVLYSVMAKWKPERSRVYFLSGSILIVLIMANYYQATRLATVPQGAHAVSDAYMKSELYNSVEQQQMIADLQTRLEYKGRIDWLTSTRNNTPLVQEFDGMSVYSSILNKHLLHFYYEDLQVDMPFESVSRYASLGVRTNLYSILGGQFYMREKDEKAIPYGFKEVLSSDKYKAYENSYLLPVFRKTTIHYDSALLKDAPILAREHAMLQGAIVENSQEFAEVPQVMNLTDFEMIPFGATYDGEKLKVTEKTGGLTFQFDEKFDDGDIYFSFYVEGINRLKRFTLQLNEYKTIRKASNSIYRTGVNQITVRVKADELFTLTLPKGDYNLRDIEISEENYETLKTMKSYYNHEKPLTIEWENGHVRGSVESEHANEVVVTPIPIEQGWTLRVNGEKVPIEKVNFAFIGIPLTEGMNEIDMKYRPPYFSLTWTLSLLGVLMLIWISSYYYRKSKKA